jgi:hypothetical protein
MSDNPTTIKVTPVENGKFTISGVVNVLAKAHDGKVSCYIPGFDIFFTASNDDIKKAKTIAFVKFYFDHFFKYEMKNALKKMAFDLNQKGFVAENHQSTMHDLVNNKIIPAKFRPRTTVAPIGFEDATISHNDFSLAA